MSLRIIYMEELKTGLITHKMWCYNFCIRENWQFACISAFNCENEKCVFTDYNRLLGKMVESRG